MSPLHDTHPLGVADDAACFTGAAWGSVDHPHVDADPTAPGRPEHCVYCHLQRALAGASPASLVVLVAPEGAALAARLVEDAPAAAVFSAHASRAPPASSVL